MCKVRMLNLYRCSSAENIDNKLMRELNQDELRYFVTDYFDEIKVDTLDMEKASLQQCMGIMPKANIKKGVSHQRYCLYSDSKEENIIWDRNPEYPLLTIIQIFINPELYQANYFWDGSSVTVKKIQDKLFKYVERLAEEMKKETPDLNIDFQLYQLLTAGDFAIIVRSNKTHAAYDVSTAIRSIRISIKVPNKIVQDEALFYTYSICGVYDEEIASWSRYLSSDDRVVVRLRYSHSFRKILSEKDLQIKTDLVQMGQHLFGRYDHQISYSPQEFEILYPFIKKFKTQSEIKYNEEKTGIPKVDLLIEMLVKRYVSHINERLLLQYDYDEVLNGKASEEWIMVCERPWISLFAQNNKKINQIKTDVQELDRFLKPYYQSDHNLKEYIRLLGRLGRVFFEINKRQELRISLAYLLIQYETLVKSFIQYVAMIPKEQMKLYAEIIAEYLRYGIGALEIFTRYMRNVNLQTLQTPNYDLQTNVSIMKLLLAYSQFLKPYVTKKEEPYFLTKSFNSIIVPSMRTQDMSVAVLFDIALNKDKMQKPFLMVVYCPTFAFLCETCFLVPAVFHEIAHQFRYESREDRNNYLKKYIVKQLLHAVVLRLLDENAEYDLKNISVIKNVVDIVYDECIDGGGKECLQIFKEQFTEDLLAFVTVNTRGKVSIKDAVTRYLEMTKDSIQRYDHSLLEIVCEIDKQLLEDNKLCVELSKGKKENRVKILLHSLNIRKQLKLSIKKLNVIQECQICQEISHMLKNIIKQAYQKEHLLKTPIVGNINVLVQKLEEHVDGLNAAIEKNETWIKEELFLENLDSEVFGRKIFEIWTDELYEELSGIQDSNVKENIHGIIHLLKQYHNIHDEYVWFYRSIPNYPSDQDSIKKQMTELFQETKSHALFSKICLVIHRELLDQLNIFIQNRSEKLDWDESSVSIEHLQHVAKEIRIRGKEGIQEKLEKLFLRFSIEELADFIDQKIELYREVTSDLFMCSAMCLDFWGYLVVISEMFNFNEIDRNVLLQRIFLVEQCLCMKEEEGLLKEEFREKIKKRLAVELKQLNQGIQRIKLKDESLKEHLNQLVDCEYDGLTVETVNELREVLSKCETEETEPSASTRNWIIRVYLQILSIIPRLLEYGSIWKTIGDAELLKDISAPKSYHNNEKIYKMIKENGDDVLCEEIAGILNSPALYFVERRPLLQHEINFIFDKYEQCCKKIFEQIGE